jgi:hypothetical protein
MKGPYSAAYMSPSALEALLYLVFGGHKVVLIASWFFLDSYYQYQCSDTICLEGVCAWVHSRCALLVSIGMSFVLVTPIQKVMLWMDLPFLGFMSFWILRVLYRIDPLLEYVQFVLSEDGTVQLAGVSAPLGLLISLYSVTPRSLWSVCYFS